MGLNLNLMDCWLMLVLAGLLLVMAMVALVGRRV